MSREIPNRLDVSRAADTVSRCTASQLHDFCSLLGQREAHRLRHVIERWCEWFPHPDPLRSASGSAEPGSLEGGEG